MTAIKKNIVNKTHQDEFRNTLRQPINNLTSIETNVQTNNNITQFRPGMIVTSITVNYANKKQGAPTVFSISKRMLRNRIKYYVF
jgi:hypothetical protein